MAQQTRSTDTDTAGDTDTDTNTVAKCDRECCPAGRGSCPTDLASHARREKATRERRRLVALGAAIKSYLNDKPGGRREGWQVWLAVPLKIKPNGEGQGERVQAKKR